MTYKTQTSNKILLLVFLGTLFFVSNIVYAKLPGLNLGTVTATSALVYGDYKIYSDLGSDGEWARIIIRDLQDLETFNSAIIDVGEIETFSDLGFDVAVTDVRTLDDRTVIGTDVAVDSAGKIMTGTITATDSLELKYNIYPTLAVNDEWVKVIIKDFHDNVLDTLIINEDETRQSSSAGLAINADDIIALEDGTVLSVKLVVGKAGTVDATNALEYRGYFFNSDLGSPDAWARITITDDSGKSYLSMNLNKGSTRMFSDFYIKLLDIRALQDGTVLGADIIVGNSKSVKTNGWIEYTKYNIYSNLGSNDEWAKVRITDSDGIVEHLIINKGETKDSTIGVRIGVSAVRALTDGTVIGADIVVGSIESEEPPTTTTTTTTPEYPQITDQWCDAINPCPEGLECFSFPGIGLRCAQPNPCSYFECPEGTQCLVAAIYPGLVRCSISREETTTTTTTTMPPTTTTTELSCPSGCIYDGSCISFGTRLIREEMSSYCDIDKSIKPQKTEDDECQNNYECESNICEASTCGAVCDGCLYNNRCLPLGTRRRRQYCSWDDEMEDQKGGEESCDNNFECFSNSCIDGQCLKEGVIQRLIRLLLSLFGG